jgi:hypothetical protein
VQRNARVAQAAVRCREPVINASAVIRALRFVKTTSIQSVNDGDATGNEKGADGIGPMSAFFILLG